MPTRVKIGIAILLIPLAGLIVWRVTKPQEPFYKGKPYSYWIRDQYTTDNADSYRALYHAGTNGIPTLLRLLRANDSVLKIWVRDQLERRFKIKYIQPAIGHFGAGWAFSQLGSDAHAALPELIKIADENISITSRDCAIESVGYVGLPQGEAVPALLRWATNSDTNVRTLAISGLRRIGSEVHKPK